MDMAEFPGWSTSFDLMWRQETSRHASGVTRVKDFGRPVWQASWVTPILRPNALDRWRAEIDALSYSLDPFAAWPKSRCWPQAHPNGQGLTGGTTGTVASIGADNSSLTIDGIPGLTLQMGDVINVDGRLYRVTLGISIPGDQVFAGVKPYLWPGVSVGDTVEVYRPSVQMIVLPGTVSTVSGLDGRGTVSFQTIEAI